MCKQIKSLDNFGSRPPDTSQDLVQVGASSERSQEAMTIVKVYKMM